MTAILDLLDPLRAQRRRTVLALRNLREDQLTAHVGPERQSDVRAMLLNLAMDDDRRCVTASEVLAALEWQPTETHRIISAMGRTRGQLRGMLVPVTDALLDQPQAPGEWAVRQAMLHLKNNEAGLVNAANYAAERLHSREQLPVELPGSRRGPGTVGEDVPGGLEDVLAAMEQVRNELVSAVADFGSDELSAPTAWGGMEVEVRYMLYRRPMHERQHMVQMAKTLRAIGCHPSEAAMLLAEGEIARGALEGMLLGLPDDLVTRAPSQGLPSIAQLLEDAARQEATKAEAIRAAVS
jgi:hypothetical protein